MHKPKGVFLVLETKRTLVCTSACSPKHFVLTTRKSIIYGCFCISYMFICLCCKSEGWAGGWGDLGTLFINCMAMGQVRFIIYPMHIFLILSVTRRRPLLGQVLIQIVIDGIILELCDLCDYCASPLLMKKTGQLNLIVTFKILALVKKPFFATNSFQNYIRLKSQ